MQLERGSAQLVDLVEEHISEEGAFSELDKVNKGNVNARLKEIKDDEDSEDEAGVLRQWLKLTGKEAALKRVLKEGEADLDTKAYSHYPTLTESEIKMLVVDYKWIAALEQAIHGELDRVSQQLSHRMKELAERYEAPLPMMANRAADYESKVSCHLVRMAMKPGYKQTEAGMIPHDWELARIGAVCTLINGRGFKPFEWKKTGLPIIRIQNLNGSDDFNHYEGLYDRKLEVEPGQLLFAWSGSRGTSFGPHVWKGPLGLLNYHTWKVQVQEYAVGRGFFYHALRQLTAFIEGSAHGASALVHTQKWEMEGFRFPLPPTKAEQEAIAEALSDADAFIDSLEQLLAKKRQIKQGTMQDLLTGKRRIGV